MKEYVQGGRRQMGTSAGGQYRGPERPTLTEWLIGFIPLPYVGGCILLAAIFSIPGHVLALYLDTWDINVILLEIREVQPWLFIVYLILDVLSLFLVIFAARYMRLQVMKAKADILPLLPRGEETYNKVFGRVSSFWPPLALAAIIVTFVIIPRGLPSGGLFTIIFDSAAIIVFYPMLGTFIWVYFRSTLGLHMLGKESLKLKPYYEDSMLGLLPLGSLSLSLARPFLAVGAIVAVIISLGTPPPNPQTIGLVSSLIVLGVVMFFLPLNGVHRVMLVEQQKARVSVQDQSLRFMERPQAPQSGTPKGTPTMESLLARLTDASTLDITERKVAAISIWPFDTRILRRFGALVASVATGVSGSFVISQLGF
ncbi:MAG: hypothetical protein V3W22_01030 [Thermoplasmata archaeon]